MTITTFEFKHCTRWNLLKMFLIAFFQRKISLAWDPPIPEMKQSDLFVAGAVTGRVRADVPNESAQPRQSEEIAA